MNRAVLGMLLATICACSPPSEQNGSNGSAATNAQAQDTIGSEGGTVTTDVVTLQIPPGALDTDEEIVVSATGDDPPVGSSTTPVFRFEPAGLTFSEPVTVTFEVGEARGSIWWADSDGSNPEELDTSVSAGKASAEVDHFSLGWFYRPDDCPAEPACGGTGDSCECRVECAGTLYELQCQGAGCQCLVDGAAGPASTATGCADGRAALIECGASLPAVEPAPDMGTADTGASGCGGVAGSGTPGGCTSQVECDGVTYLVECAESSCTCSVDGDPGPASSASDCSAPEEALAECGAPVDAPEPAPDMGVADTGGGCGAIGGTGSPGECSGQVSCDGTTYVLECDTNAGVCTCTVDGAAGPDSTATDCTTPDASLRECGAPL